METLGGAEAGIGDSRSGIRSQKAYVDKKRCTGQMAETISFGLCRRTGLAVAREKPGWQGMGDMAHSYVSHFVISLVAV
jgi:hypothetical protein